MKIFGYNPVGYTATTPKGNTYKKSNLGKTICTAGEIATVGTLLLSKNKVVNEILKNVSMIGFIDIAKEFVKPETLARLNKPLKIAAYVGDILIGGLLTGKIIDDFINKSRIKKADNE